MVHAKWLSFLLGVIGGSLFAVSVVQYQDVLSQSQHHDLSYSVGGRSFYFVLLQEEESLEADDVDVRGNPDSSETRRGKRDQRGERGDVGDSLDRERSGRSRVTNGRTGKGTPGDSTPAVSPELAALAASSEYYDPLSGSDLLRDKIRILCIVPLEGRMSPEYSKPLQSTWTKHCNRTLLISNMYWPTDDGRVVLQDLKEGWWQAWSRTRLSLVTAHDRYAESYDWFVVVPADGFLVAENLRYLLLKHRATVPGYVGHVFGGPRGGASVIVLSRHALKLIRPSLPACTAGFLGGSDDGTALESCFRDLGVVSARDGRDPSGVLRFQMRVPNTNLPKGATSTKHWNWKLISDPGIKDPERCCTEYTISFHNVRVSEMYLLEYMVYQMRPFGIGGYACPSVPQR